MNLSHNCCICSQSDLLDLLGKSCLPSVSPSSPFFTRRINKESGDKWRGESWATLYNGFSTSPQSDRIIQVVLKNPQMWIIHRRFRFGCDGGRGRRREAQREVVRWTSPRNDYSAISQLWPSALKEKENHLCKKKGKKKKSSFPEKSHLHREITFIWREQQNNFMAFVLIKERNSFLF